ncbi:Type I secretion system ATP-binding protein PrsD [Anaplasma phagocytophilum]|nr:Type I secretion system ATP-binding protein PrsD [Anaplasma phagocytophilum]
MRLDGADVYTWNREDFGRHVGYLPQDVELFNASIKTNIARMMPDADPEKVIKAAMIAGIHEMILQLPNGYDTIIGSGGVVLSGGQKQMLGLARAFYGDVKLLVLDEPNANLDGKAEANLMQALRYAKQRGITTFVVTHKVQLLNAVDQVVVMDDGMLSAMGSKDEILSKFSARPPTAPSNQVTKPPLPPAAPKQESGTAVVKSDGTTAAGVSRQESVNRVAVTESDSAVTNTHAEQEGTVEKEKVTDSRVVGAAKIRVRRYGASNASNPLRERRRRTYGKQATPDQVSDSSRVVISDHNADGKSAGVVKKRRYGNSKSRKIAGTQETNRGKKATSTDDVPIGD